MSADELVLEPRAPVLLAPASRPAADVEVDAELERDRMFGRMKTQQPIPIATQYGARRNHLRVEQRMRRQQA